MGRHGASSPAHLVLRFAAAPRTRNSPQKTDKRKRRCLCGSQNILDVAQPTDNNSGTAELIPAESPGGGEKGRAGGGRLRGRCRPCRWPLRRAVPPFAALCRAVPRRPACRALSAGRGGGGGRTAPRRPASACGLPRRSSRAAGSGAGFGPAGASLGLVRLPWGLVNPPLIVCVYV